MKNTFYFLTVLVLLVACKPPKLDFSKIVFEADACFGTCPVFNMTITDDGKAAYYAKLHNNQQGVYNTVLSMENLDTLSQLLNKVDIFSLPDKYSSSVTDMPTYTLTIKYKNGQSKKIVDYGPVGPESLQNIYRYFFSLRNSQSWK